MANTATQPKLIVPAVGGIYEAGRAWGYPLMRFVLGLWLVPHGMQKLFGAFGGNIDGTAKFFANVGLEPALPLAYLTGTVEFFGGILVAIGLLTRPAAAACCILLLVATFQVHLPNGFFWTGRGFEYPLMWAVMMFAVFLQGGGAKSLDARIGKEF